MEKDVDLKDVKRPILPRRQMTEEEKKVREASKLINKQMSEELTGENEEAK